MSRSPMGLRQSVGGDINFADSIASWSAFASSRTRDFGFLSGSSPAASQISFATREDTRTNSSSRKAASLYDFVSSSSPWNRARHAHGHERAELDSMGMRRNFLRLR